jgi:hypothetical protein
MNRCGRRRSLPGNALIEFVLTLPIIVFVTGLTMYMSMGMLAKQQTLTDARHQLALNHWGWPPMELDPRWTGPSSGTVDFPRGEGQALNRLKVEVDPVTIQKVSSDQARDYWRRLWGNLPARQHTEASRSFQTQGSLWNYLPKTATSDQYGDQNEWRHFSIDCWKISRSGPLHPIYQSFWDNMQAGVAPHFETTRKEIIRRWFHGEDELDPNYEQKNQVPPGQKQD